MEPHLPLPKGQVTRYHNFVLIKFESSCLEAKIEQMRPLKICGTFMADYVCR
jgi:hypothetical protein